MSKPECRVDPLHEVVPRRRSSSSISMHSLAPGQSWPFDHWLHHGKNDVLAWECRCCRREIFTKEEWESSSNPLMMLGECGWEQNIISESDDWNGFPFRPNGYFQFQESIASVRKISLWWKEVRDCKDLNMGYEVCADMLRDVCGHLYYHGGISNSVLTANNCEVFKVARGIYDARSFDDLPILADALEDADYDDESLLSHLRSPGTHIRGCWALDVVLGKE